MAFKWSCEAFHERACVYVCVEKGWMRCFAPKKRHICSGSTLALCPSVSVCVATLFCLSAVWLVFAKEMHFCLCFSLVGACRICVDAGNAGCDLCEDCAAKKRREMCVCMCIALVSVSCMHQLHSLMQCWYSETQSEYWVVMECGTSRTGCWRTQYCTFWGIKKARFGHHVLTLMLLQTCVDFFIL